jgi:hypothetical protein
MTLLLVAATHSTRLIAVSVRFTVLGWRSDVAALTAPPPPLPLLVLVMVLMLMLVTAMVLMLLMLVLWIHRYRCCRLWYAQRGHRQGHQRSASAPPQRQANLHERPARSGTYGPT